MGLSRCPGTERIGWAWIGSDWIWKRNGTNANVQLDRGSGSKDAEKAKEASGLKGGAAPGDTCELSAAIKAATATWIRAAFTSHCTVGQIHNESHNLYNIV